MSIKEWALGHAENTIRAYHPRVDVNLEDVLELYQERHSVDLSKAVTETPTDTLIEIASQFGNITAEMIHNGHRKKHGKAHPRCPVPQ